MNSQKAVEKLADDNVGCMYVVGKHKVFNIKTQQWQDAAEFCNKIPLVGSVLCPKHDLIVSEVDNENKRKMERAGQGEKEALSGRPA